jgi:hypothetical protein
MTRTSLLLALLAPAIAPASAFAATLTVTTTADSGAGSLRQAIIDAQAAGPDEIVFGKATYRPTVTVTNLTSGIKKTYTPKISVKRKKGK